MRCLRSLSIVAVAVTALAGASIPDGLKSPSDCIAFRRWFAFLSESRYFARKTARQTTDSPALIRWAYQQALIDHDPAWARSTELPILPHMPSVRESALLPTTIGIPGDLPPLHLVSREIADALPGDILRFRNSAPANLMVYIGESQVLPSRARWVVYLAGPPRDGQPFCVHRLLLQTLLSDPSPAWRPASDNPEFLGVWRFDILGNE